MTDKKNKTEEVTCPLHIGESVLRCTCGAGTGGVRITIPVPLTTDWGSTQILRLELSNWVVTPKIYETIETKVRAKFLGRPNTSSVQKGAQQYVEDLLKDLFIRDVSGVSLNEDGGCEKTQLKIKNAKLLSLVDDLLNLLEIADCEEEVMERAKKAVAERRARKGHKKIRRLR
jgi:hypothetical protein